MILDTNAARKKLLLIINHVSKTHSTESFGRLPKSLVAKILTIQIVASSASFNAIAISFSSESSALLPGAFLCGDAKGARLKLEV